MRQLLFGLLVIILTCSPAYANNFFNGTLVDAHSQKGALISSQQLSEVINKTDVDFTLLSFRLKPGKIKEELLAIKQETGNKVRYLIPTKLGGYMRKNTSSEEANNRLKFLKKTAQESNMNYVGFGEIIVQHAPHNHSKLKYDGINLDLSSKRVSEAIDIIIKDNKSVIIHVELNDYETDSKKILKQLVTLGNKNPDSNFLLMHMAQVKFSEAEFIINNTKNIHFMTSHADNEMKLKMKKGRGQQGWINLFDKDNNLQKKWRNLMNNNPKRFVFALDNVWDVQWLRGYKERVLIWRKALASLDDEASISIACRNSNEYFKLGIECIRDRN
ncbi:MAG: hypothetical protein HOE17_04495 [Rhodobiaceae bacterium]|jgi:glycerophosphoryl diester phosphodiesterase|nr:hypothetical protein [Rhodobiaceae bacterium]